ncbi:MAG: aldo/keto reductase, partial [Bacteroidales bacterium]|nr:aldo/keto reductase [Bacteroidales bacterium]
MDNNAFNRRTFLKTSLLGTAGTLFGHRLMSGGKNPSLHLAGKTNKIVRRKLGNTGIELPVVSFGVMRADNPNLVKAAMDAGVEHFDTAHKYQNGNNEKMLGEVLKDYPRDSFTIATKIPELGEEKNEETGEILPGFTKKEFLNKLDTSLERLQMDYVDMLYIHSLSMRDAVLHEPVLDALKTAKKQGKAKHIGISVHSNEPEVIKAAIDSGVYEVVLTAVNFKQSHREKVLQRIEEASKAGLGIIAMKTMAGGKIGKGENQKMKYQAALKWALHNPHIHTTIPGITAFEQLQENMAVMNDLTLNDKEKDFLLYASSLEGLYCDGCKQCTENCRKGLPVPDMMRAYMYAHGYRETMK